MISNYDEFKEHLRDKFLINGDGFDESNLLTKCQELLKYGQQYKTQLEKIKSWDKIKADFYKQFSNVKSFTEFLVVDIEKWFKQYIDFHTKNQEFSEAITKEYYEVITEIYYDDRLNPMDVFNGKAKHPIKSETYLSNGKKHREDGPAFVEYNRKGEKINEEYWLDGVQYTDMFKWSVIVGNKKGE